MAKRPKVRLDALARRGRHAESAICPACGRAGFHGLVDGKPCPNRGERQPGTRWSDPSPPGDTPP